MGFKPSNRRKRGEYDVELNLAPLLSLFVALIPMLLLTAVFQQVGIVNLFLPTAEEARYSEDVDAVGDFTLTLTVTPGEISLRRDDEILYRDASSGEFDLPALKKQLIKVKVKAPAKTDLVLLLDGSVLYETIIDIMDAARESEDGELFPDISLADRVLEVSL